MRILLLTSRLPYPPNRGDRLRAYGFIRHLAREHELALVSFVAGESEQEGARSLGAYCRQVHVVPLSASRSVLGAATMVWRRDPLQVLYYRSKAMRSVVDRVMSENRFDLVYVHLFRMAPYAAGLRGYYRVVDLTDVISQEVSRSLPYRGLAWRFVYGIERPRLERFERWVANSFEETWLISEADRSILAASCPKSNIQVVPNGVDTERFYPLGEPDEPDSIVFVGHLGVFHNVDAAGYLVRDVLPLVRRRQPGCTLQIVGMDPAPEVQRLADGKAVTVTGYVDNLNLALNRAAVFVAPLRFAAGVQNKVLEAMAAGRPVVTTSVVNAGLGARPGTELLVADEPHAMADQIVALLQDAAMRSRLGLAGLQFVRRHYSWQGVVERMRMIEENLARPDNRVPRTRTEVG